MFNKSHWLRKLTRWLGYSRPSVSFRRPRTMLHIEQLETRELPAVLTSAGSLLTYTAAADVNNNISVATSGANFVVTDLAEIITTTIPGALGSGTNTVTIPIAGNATAGVVLDLGNGADTIDSAGVLLTATGSNAAPLAVNHSGTGLTISGPLTTVAKSITIDNSGTGALTINGAVSSANGNIALTSANGIALSTNVNAGTGTIAIVANNDGTGTQGFAQTAGAITSTNTGTSAASITVNTASGGTGSISIDSTAISGTLTISSNGGSILYAGATALTTSQQGTANGGSAPTRTLAAKNYVFTATGAGSIGTSARPIQSSALASNSVLLSAGSGGAYWTDWVNPLNLAGATATGAGNIRVVTANAGSHNLSVTGPVTTGSGSIYLAADDDFTLTGAIGGAGFSGTVYIAANRDLGNAVNLRMNAGASITTSNATASAVLLEGNSTSGTAAGGIILNNITVGNGGTIRATTIPTSQPTSNGDITAFNSSVVLHAGSSGNVVLIARPYAASSNAIGSATTPIVVTAGTVTAAVTALAATNGNIHITGTGPTSFAATIGGAAGLTGQMNLTTTNGALTISGATSVASGGTINLNGAGGVVLNATLGSSGTGAIGITGPLSGSGNVQLGTGGLTLTQASDSTYAGAVSGTQGLTKAGAGVLTLTGSSGYMGATTVNAGGLLVNGTLTATSSATAAAGATLGGSGSVNAAASITGSISPGSGAGTTAILNTGNLSFAAGGKLIVDLNSATVPSGYDQVRVTGTVNLTSAALQINIAPGFSVGQSFTIIKNVTGNAVVGQFTTGTTISALGYSFTIDYANGPTQDVVLTISAISPLMVDAVGNQVIYNSAPGINNSVTLSHASNVYTIQDGAGAIALTGNAMAAGWTINAGVASGPSTGMTGVTFSLSDGADSTGAVSTGGADLALNGSGTLTLSGAVATTGALSLAQFGTITANGSLSASLGLSISSTGPLTLNGTGSVTSTGGNVNVHSTNGLTVSGLTVSSNGTTTLSGLSTATMAVGDLTVTNGALSVSSASTLTLNGVISAAGAVTIAGVTTLSSSGAGQNIIAPTLNAIAPTIGSSTTNLRTQADTIVASAGAGGVYITQNGAVDVTASATSSGNISIINLSGTLTIAGPMTTSLGNITLASARAIALNANLNAGSGTIAISANTAGVGTAGFAQASGTSITTTNTSAGAASITVNTVSGGAGDAVLGALSVGSNAGGTLTVNSNGGSILSSNTATLTAQQRGVAGNGGTAPTPVISAANYHFTATGAGSIGTDANPIQTTNFGTDGLAGGSSFHLHGGDGGVYLTDWGGIDLTLAGASATGAGNIRVVTANVAGHNLHVTGNVTAASGNIYLAADDNLEIRGSAIIGGAGFSGTVWLSGNRDVGTTGQSVAFDSTASIITSNTTNQNVALSARTPTTQAVYIEIGGGSAAGVGVVQLGNITVGDGGRVVLNGGNQASPTQAGSLAMASASNVINVGATGALELSAILSSTTAADNIGTAAMPIKVAGGNVVVNSQFGNVWVTGTATTRFGVNMTALSGQTAGPSIHLATSAGQMIVGSALANINGGVVSLTGAGGVALDATLGSTSTGAININGPLSGSGDIEQGSGAVTITQNGDSSYAGDISGNQDTVIDGAGTLTVTGTSTTTGAIQVNAGTLLVNSPGSIASAVNVASGAVLGGTGATGPVTAAGTIRPGDTGAGTLTTTSANVAAAGNLTVQITGFATAGTDYDQLNLGSGTLTLGGTSVLTLDLAGLATTGIANQVIAFGAISGTFAQVTTLNNPHQFVPIVRYGASSIDIILTAAATHFQVIPTPATVTAGGSVSVTVMALDAYENVAYGYAGAVHLTSTDGQAVLPTDAGLINGVGAFIVTLKSAGSQTITASDTVTNAIAGTSAAVVVSHDVLNRFSVTATPATSVAGTTFDFTVTALDQYGNTVTAYAGTPSFTSADTSVHTTLPTGVSLVNGAAVVSARLTQVGSQTISVRDDAITGASSTIQVVPASAARLVVSASPTIQVAGAPLSLSVTAEDRFGNVATGYSGTIRFSSGDGNALAGLPPDTTLANGVGSFSATLTTAGTQTISVGDGTISGASALVLITPAALNRFALTGAPAAIAAGSAFAINVTGQDLYGNTVTSYSGNAVLTSSDSGTHTSIPAQVSLSNGVGSFNATLSTPGVQTITASDGTITGSTTLIDVTPAPLHHFIISSTPGTATAGSAFVFTVTAQDVFGNTVTGFDGALQFSSSDTNAARSLPSGISLVAGVGTFSAALTTVGSQTITVTAGTISGTSAAIIIAPGAMHQFAITGAPASIVAGASFSFTVTAQDLYGNTVTGFNNAVTLTSTDLHAATNVPAGGTLVNGVLSFSASFASVGNQRISVTAGATTDVSDAIGVTPAALSQFVITGTPSSVTAGTSFSFGVTALDAFGNLLTDYDGPISFTATDTHAQTRLPAGTTLAAGIGSFSGTLVQAGAQQLTATNGAVAGVSSSITITAASVSQFEVTGTPAAAAAGSPFNFAVTARDAFGNVATDFAGLVQFSSSDTNAAVSLPTASTLTAGVGSFSATLAGAGTQTFTVQSGAIETDSAPIAVHALDLDHFAVPAVPATSVAGDSVSFQVVARDRFGNVAVGYTGAVHFTSSDVGATLPGDVTLVNGVGSFSAALTTAGSQTITVADQAITATSAAILVTPAAAAHFVVAAPTSTVAGASLTFTVTALDAFGNLATGYAGTAHFSSTDTNSSTRLPVNLGLVAGVGSFSAMLTTAGIQTITVTAVASPSITGSSDAIDVSHAAATRLAVAAPSVTNAGVAFSVTVTAYDPFDNIDVDFAHPVFLASTDANAQTQLPASGTLTSGVGTFSATLTTAGTQTITAHGLMDGTIVGVSDAILVVAASATRFLIDAPTAASAGSAFTLTVTALDAFGNIAVGYGGMLRFASTDGQAILPNQVSLDAGQGVFAGMLKTAGTHTLCVADSTNGMLTGTSSSVLVSAAAATRFAITDMPATTVAGAGVGFTVTAYDAFGNVATGYGGVAQFSSSDPLADVPASASLVLGVGMFNAVLRTAGSHALHAVDGAVVGESATIAVLSSTATHFTLSAPATSTAGEALAFSVIARDAFGNIAAGYTGSVAFSSSDPRADLPSRVSLTAGTGTFVATLKTAGSQSITASDGASTGNTSAISITPAAARSFALSVPAQITPAAPFDVTIRALDAFGNAATEYAGIVHFTSNDDLATLPADAQLVNGMATVTVTLQRHGSRSIAVADTVDGGIAGIAIVTVPNSAAVLSRFVVSGPAFVGAGSAATFTITALDQFGETFTAYTGSVVPISSDPHASLPAAIDTLSNGVGTFSATLTTAGSHTLTVRDSAVATITGASSIQVQPQAASQFVVAAPTTTIAGSPITFSVAALDPFGNIATGYTGAVVFTSSDPQAALPVASALVNGVGTFTGTFRKAGSQTITATDANASAILGASGTISVSAASATHFALVTSASATVGQALSITLTALDAFDNIAVGYTGTVHFTSSDSSATIPASYQFNAGNAGVYTVTGAFVPRSAGSVTLTATDGTHSGQATVSVAPAGATIALNTALGMAGPGLSTFMATITGLNGAGTPNSGLVTFSINDGSSVTILTANVNANGAASVSANLSPGSYSIAASFGGNANFTASSSESRTHVVPQHGTSVKVTGTTTLKTTTFTAQVAPLTGGFGTPAGSVVFYVNGVAASPSLPLDAAGQARFDVPTLANGDHVVMAAYTGVGDFLASLGGATFTLTRLATLGQASITANTTTVRPPVIVADSAGWSMPYSQSVLKIPLLAGDPSGSPISVSAVVSAVSSAGAAPFFSASVDLANRVLLIQNHAPGQHLSAQLRITLTASNSAGSSQKVVPLEIFAYPPTLGAIPDASVATMAGTKTISFSASDLDDTLAESSFSMSLPASAPALVGSFNSLGGNQYRLTISGFSAFVGTVPITITAFDGVNRVSRTFNLTVTQQAPVLPALPDVSIVHDPAIAPVIAITASDPDGTDILTYSVRAYDGLAYQAYQQKQALGLTGPFASYYVGQALGQGEKWMTSRDGNYYALLANGNLVKWLGTAAATNSAPALGVYDANYFADPSRLWNAAAPAALLDYVSLIGSQVVLTPPAGYMGSFVVEAIVSDGLLSTMKSFAVTVTNHAPTLALLSDVTMQHSTVDNPSAQVVTLLGTDVDAQDMLSYRVNAYDALAYQAYQHKQRLGLNAIFADYYIGQALGLNEKWMTSRDGNYYALLPSGDLVKWLGTAAATNAASVLGRFDASYYADPTKLWNADAPTSLGGFFHLNGNQLTLTPPPGFAGKLVFEASASDGILSSLKQTFTLAITNSAPVLAAVSDVTMQHSTLAMPSVQSITLSGADPDADDALSYAITAYDALAYQAYQQKQALGLNAIFANYYLGQALGQGEKWMTSRDGNYYALLPNGNLVKWLGTAAATNAAPLIGVYDASYYADPSRLWNAAAPTAVHGGFYHLVGSQLTLTPPPGFTGRLTFEVSASDGMISSAKQTFNASVTNSAPTLAMMSDVSMPGSSNTRTITIDAFDGDAVDVLIYSAQAYDVLAYQADALRRSLGLVAPFANYHLGQVLGLNEKWLTASDGNYYALLPNGELRRWAGSYAATMQASSLMHTFDADSYADPSLLWNAATPAPLSGYVAMNGNQLTLAPRAGYTGRYVVEVTVSDGITSSRRTFIVTVN